MSRQDKRLWQFAEFLLDCDHGLLYRAGTLIPLAPKVVQTLVPLVEHAGELVTKDELIKSVWPDTFVDESNLASNIHILRRTLNSNGVEQFIETLPKRGYRFIARVERVPAPEPAPIEPAPEPVETSAAPEPAPVVVRPRWRWALAILAATIVTAAMLLGRRNGSPAPEPRLVRLTANAGSNTQPDVSRDGRIVFVSNRDGGKGQIYVMNADGSRQHNLSGDPAVDDDSPAWSPDGQKIAFQSKRHGSVEIFTMDPNGSHQAAIAPGARAAWSPDSKMLAFARVLNDHQEIFVVAADGSSPPRQVTFDHRFCVDPTWSPDGSRIAFTSAGEDRLEIHSMRLDGSDRRVLAARHGANRVPVWFRDGRIAFNSDRDGHDAIFVMESDGTLQHRISDATAGDYEAAWAPDGLSLVFESEREGNSDIYRMRLPDSVDGATALTRGLANNVHPSWSPDGKWIAFESSRDGAPNIFVMDTDGENVRNLTPSPAASHRPVWSSDGTAIAYEMDHDGTPSIAVMSADGSNPHRVSEGASDKNPAWSPDGRQICFDRDGQDVWVVASNGGPARRLAPGVECSWEAGGRRILFARSGAGAREIYAVTSDGRDVTNLTRNGRGNGTPASDRYGRQIAFNSDLDGFGFGIFVMGPDGSLQTRITARHSFDMQPSWSPDSHWVAFARDLNHTWEIYKIAVPLR